MELKKIVVIGTSMGGLKALKQLLPTLTDQLPIAILVVQHLLEDTPSELPFLLKKYSKFTVHLAQEYEIIEAGHVYIAMNGKHLLVNENRIEFGMGMRDNGMKPSINALFKSVAAHYSQRAIGILLTGLLTDGSEGLKAIKEMGGTTIVQDPDEAEYPDMPVSAVKMKVVDYVVPIEAMGSLVKIISSQTVKLKKYAASKHLLKSIEIATIDISNASSIGIDEDKIDTVDSLVNILQVMQERTNMLENAAEKQLLNGRKSIAATYFSRAAESRIHTENLRRFLYEECEIKIADALDYDEKQ